MDTEVLRKWVRKSNPEWLLEEVVVEIVRGADLCVRENYVPTRSANTRYAFIKGKWVIDTIALGILQGIYCGPFDDY